MTPPNTRRQLSDLALDLWIRGEFGAGSHEPIPARLLRLAEAHFATTSAQPAADQNEARAARGAPWPDAGRVRKGGAGAAGDDSGRGAAARSMLDVPRKATPEDGKRHEKGAAGGAPFTA